MKEAATWVTSIRESLKIGDWHSALRVAVKLRHHGKDQEIVARGWEASCRPDNYLQMRQNPERHIEAAIEVLRRCYGDTP